MRSDRTTSGRSRVVVRRRGRRGVVGSMFLTTVLLLSGCSLPDGPSTGTTGDASDDGPSEQQDDAVEPPDEPSDHEDEDLDTQGEPDGTPGCPASVLTGVEQTIGAQLDAFADDDIAEALSYASDAFRAQIDTASFERLITEAFPAVADPASFSVEGCRSEQASAQVLVDVVGADGERMNLVYIMVEEAGRWAIDGAQERTSDPGLVA